MKPYWTNGSVEMHLGDCREVLASLPERSIQTCITSPPYWGLRDYGIGDDSLGLEPTPELYVQHMVEVFRAVRRVLRDDGTVGVVAQKHGRRTILIDVKAEYLDMAAKRMPRQTVMHMEAE